MCFFYSLFLSIFYRVIRKCLYYPWIGRFTKQREKRQMVLEFAIFFFVFICTYFLIVWRDNAYLPLKNLLSFFISVHILLKYYVKRKSLWSKKPILYT